MRPTVGVGVAGEVIGLSYNLALTISSAWQALLVRSDGVDDRFQPRTEFFVVKMLISNAAVGDLHFGELNARKQPFNI